MNLIVIHKKPSDSTGDSLLRFALRDEHLVRIILDGLGRCRDFDTITRSAPAGLPLDLSSDRARMPFRTDGCRAAPQSTMPRRAGSAL